jgi:predicted secreted protein
MGRRAVLLHTVAAALGAAGCQAATQEASQMVVVSSAQDGATVALRAGGRLQLRLPAQLGTGYSWAPDPSPGLLRLDGQRVASPAELRPGGTETQVLDFTATGAGSETLLLAYRRPWEPAAPARRFRLRVEIAP